MSAKMATLDLLQIKTFSNICYDVIISGYDVINKILSRDSNFIVKVVMWPKFGNSSILVQVQWFGTDTSYGFEISHQCCKRVKTKGQKVVGANSNVCGNNRGKTGSSPSWIGLNHFDSIFSKSQCAFRKDFNVQHILLSMIDKWTKSGW